MPSQISPPNPSGTRPKLFQSFTMLAQGPRTIQKEEIPPPERIYELETQALAGLPKAPAKGWIPVAGSASASENPS
jgi:hypothetical protein